MKTILFFILLFLLSGCSNLSLEQNKKAIDKPTSQETNIQQENNTNTILAEKEYTGDLILGKGENYKIYKNESIGISLVYVGNEKSYIKEIGGKLQFVDYFEKMNKYSPNGQDYIEVYRKNTNDSFKEAVIKIISEQVSSLDQCLIKTSENNGRQIVNVTYEDEYVFDKNKCFPDDEGHECLYRQVDEHTKLAFANCSNFEKGPYGNYFIYQPQNTKNKIVFIRHVGGMDAAPWDASTIQLFESK